MGWVWASVGAVIAVVGVAVWAARPEAVACESSADGGVQTLPTWSPATGGSSGVAARHWPPLPPMPGEARYYSSRSTVACSFEDLPADGLYAGLSTAEFGRADLCGGHLDVRGPRGAVRVLVADRCPGCAPGQLDLSTAAFDRIADRADGVAQISYRLVRDPEPAPELGYVVKPDSTAGWFALLITGTGNPIRQVAMRGVASEEWRDLTRGMDNYWTLVGGGSGPFVARITDAYGHEAEIVGVTPDSGEQRTGVRLYTAQPVDPVPVAPPAASTVRAEPSVMPSLCVP
ncbi:Pollen allergen [Nocardia amikacinitolerans]|uniref:expansin EXLX1 family cellulose-binding protein n=1 Tax=Nocardia amikacinitolerans TaxID=756689 RepID=UPI000833CB84|nr:expansin EXLX1 family cellulose-binding protein [Nocardia amikacinitolerans]MCP2315177.1 Pollen allergen [Nocardia amikacinitolerans]